MSPAPEPAEPAPKGHSGVVLLVEDNPVNQLVASEMLRLLGAEVVCAFDGLEALDAVRGRRFDLVLMDVQMPGMDGVEATQQIRRHERSRSLPETPIIALTANASNDDRERCLCAGMCDFLAKPVKTEQFAALLARYLRPAD